MIAPHEWHPLAVHFPLALVVTGALALSAARLARTPERSAALATVGTFNLVAGALTALLALGTGLAAVVALHLGPAARPAISLHVKWAVATAVGLVFVAVWRGAGQAREARPSNVFLVLLWVVTAALIMTGYRGGQNVYRYGIGVRALHPVRDAGPGELGPPQPGPAGR